MQKALRHHEWLRIFVGIWFQVLFHRPPGLLFTFPSRYLFTIDHQKYLAFPDRSGRFARGSRASRYSGTATGFQNFLITGLLPSVVVRSRIVHLNLFNPNVTALQPLHSRFGLIPVRSPLLREYYSSSMCVIQKNIPLTLKKILRYLFLRLLKCFTSAGTAL